MADETERDEQARRLVDGAPIWPKKPNGVGVAENAGGLAQARAFGFSRVGDLPPIRPITWLIKSFIEANSIAMMFGDPGIGKSFLAIDIACSVATGTEWHGNRVTPGAVFYISGEGMNSIAKRFRAWEIRHRSALGKAPLYISNHAAQFCDLSAADEVSGVIKTLAAVNRVHPALVVIDTLARNFGPGDENSTHDMSLFVTNIDGALRHPFNACVLIIHHVGHQEKTRGRGSIALKGALDAEYLVTCDAHDVLRVEALKMKDAPRPAPLAFERRSVELGVTDEDGENVTSLVLDSIAYVPPPKAGCTGSGKNQTLFMQVLRELAYRNGGDGVSETALREELKTRGLNRQQIHDAKQGLLDADFITTGDGGTLWPKR